MKYIQLTGLNAQPIIVAVEKIECVVGTKEGVEIELANGNIHASETFEQVQDRIDRVLL